MKLKRLSILGFKSFMDRAQISFPEGISAIVGPNGCGKSNIVDAIRWCMGEQSPKKLRGRSMEDVIFSGAGDHKPLGMAEVTIVLDNPGTKMPPGILQQPEIAITRRLYRSGESEYLINNIPCRLKDILELFMDTGLGNRAYSLIGQGMIGAIVDQRPEETRQMLEEAAGITKYRKKVEESQKRISLTEANLQRVEDILGEVERQMRSLKRQASKAKKYNAVCEQIKDLELRLFSNLFHELKSQSKVKYETLRELIQNEAAQSAIVARLQNEIQRFGIELEEMDKKLADLRKAYLETKEKLQAKEVLLGSLDHEQNLQQQIEGRLREEKKAYQDRTVKLQQEEEEIRAAINSIAKRLDSLRANISVQEQLVASKQQVLQKVRQDYEDIRESLTANREKESGLEHESGYLEKLLSQISETRMRLEKELQEIINRKEEIAKASERKMQLREAEAQRLAQIQEAIEQETANNKRWEEEAESIEQQLKAIEAELNAARSRLSSLKTLAENFEGYQVGVRTIMKAKDLGPRQKGHILGLVADVIEVEPRYEQAVEAVLSDKLQYIIVESHEDGKEAVQYLKSRARGRSSFVPLRELNGNGSGPSKHNGFPALRELVNTDDSFRPIINALLGDTVVVEDLDTAIQAWRSNGRNQCIVTLEGDVVDERGIISGGKLLKTSKGLLSRKREIAELERTVEIKQRETDALRTNLSALNDRLKRGKVSVEARVEDRWECQERINQIDSVLFRLGQELDRMEKLSSQIKKEMERKEREGSRHRIKLQEIAEQLRRSKDLRAAKKAYFEEKQQQLSECEKELEKTKEELSATKADYRIVEEEQKGLQNQLQRLRAYLAEATERLEKIDGEIQEAREKQFSYEEEKKHVALLIEDLREDVEMAAARVQSAERDRQELQTSVKELENKLDQARKELSDLKETISRAKMEGSEIQIRMNSLADMAREKYGVDLPGLYQGLLMEQFSEAELRQEIEQKKQLKQKLGEVNLAAIKEHEALKERHEFIKTQREDLITSIESLRKAIRKINKTSLEKFQETFRQVDEKLKTVFPILFNGGTAGLKLTDESRPLESGVLVEVQPPGKKLSHMGLLSGGEKALVAMALLFSIYLIKPSPFCLLDEVDAPLDEANIDRFNELLKEIKKSSQIILVTHNRKTMEIADRLYGVTMEEAGISKIVSVDIERVKTETQQEAPSAC